MLDTVIIDIVSTAPVEASSLTPLTLWTIQEACVDHLVWSTMGGERKKKLHL